MTTFKTEHDMLCMICGRKFAVGDEINIRFCRYPDEAPYTQYTTLAPACLACDGLLRWPLKTDQEYAETKRNFDESRRTGDQKATAMYSILIQEYLRRRRAGAYAKAKKEHDEYKTEMMSKFAALKRRK